MMDAGSGTVVVVADATTDTTGLGTPDAKVIAPPPRANTQPFNALLGPPKLAEIGP
jgi:hypothetical protein